MIIKENKIKRIYLSIRKWLKKNIIFLFKEYINKYKLKFEIVILLKFVKNKVVILKLLDSVFVIFLIKYLL